MPSGQVPPRASNVVAVVRNGESLIPSPAACEVVAGYQTWISHFTPETKQQSMHWWHSGFPVRMKFKQTLSIRKVMGTVFWDRRGILLIDFLPRGETVNTDHYCEILRILRCAIKNKRNGVVHLHDNACQHKARRTVAVLTEFDCELFGHLPYSPDPAPHDFHVVLHLKKFLSPGQERDLTCIVALHGIQWYRRTRDSHGPTYHLAADTGRCMSFAVDVPFTGGRALRQRDTKVDPTIRQVSQFWWWLCGKVFEKLLYLMPINMFLKV
ncbi:uncharacterized protein TNCV_4138361 [Trichonephila clavipes]|nr:uncharacterized protein TNCV_4138361 [Trichonephila clavipes]